MAIEDDDVPCFHGVYCCVFSCKCITRCIVSTILNLILLICLASLLVWMMLRSSAVKFQVDDTVMTRFDLDLDNNNNLHYNLSLNFTIRNSNGHMGIHYDKFKATIYYLGERLASVSVPSFYQGHKSTKAIETVFQGQNLVLLRKFDEDDMKLDFYGIDVKVRIKSRVLFFHLVTWPMKPTVTCHLKVPLGSPSNPSGGFEFLPTKCHLNF